jgi:thiosulfate dehydrogenase (quinone) large subunit
MAVQYPHRFQRRLAERLHLPAQSTEATEAGAVAVLTPVAARVVAGARIVLGFVFLWAFFDKAFGWHYATPGAKSWVNGGSPTKGFLSHVAAGPFESTFHDMAGVGWVDWLFMLSLLGLGVALIAGVALRIAAVGGTILMAMMWAAEWPPAQHLSDGTASGSTNPIVDYHFFYAVALIAFAVLSAGGTWGLGRLWASIPLVHKHSWLR